MTFTHVYKTLRASRKEVSVNCLMSPLSETPPWHPRDPGSCWCWGSPCVQAVRAGLPPEQWGVIVPQQTKGNMHKRCHVCDDNCNRPTETPTTSPRVDAAQWCRWSDPQVSAKTCKCIKHTSVCSCSQLGHSATPQMSTSVFAPQYVLFPAPVCCRAISTHPPVGSSESDDQKCTAMSAISLDLSTDISTYMGLRTNVTHICTNHIHFITAKTHTQRPVDFGTAQCTCRLA